MFKKLKNFIRANKRVIALKITKYWSLWAVYSSILIAVLTPMLIFYLGVFTFLSSFGFSFWGYTWIFMDPTLLLNGQWINLKKSWLNHYMAFGGTRPPYIDQTILPYLLLTELVIFVAGFSLFCLALYQLVRGIHQEDGGLYRGGVYRYVRHPQNLTMIIMALSFVGYVPSFHALGILFHDLGIRPADLLSWVQFTILVIMYSDLEDLRLKKKYPDEFSSYYDSTGFMFPKVCSLNLYEPFSRAFYLVRYSLLLIFYIISVILVRILYETVPIGIKFA